MVTEFRFPDVGEGITEGELVKWLVEEGDTVEADQPIAEVETDKAVVEIPSPIQGKILKRHAKEGDTIKVGAILATIGREGEMIPPPSKQDVEETPRQQMSSPAAHREEVPRADEISIFATPAVRKAAREMNIGLNTISGSGPGGRIELHDLTDQALGKGDRKIGARIKTETMPYHQQTASSKRETRVSFEQEGRVLRIPLKGARKIIAERMTLSIQTIPHVTHMDEADVTELWGVRMKEKEIAENQGFKLTFLPFVIKACAKALKNHPFLNSSFDVSSGEIVLKQYYNIGFAVDTGDSLIVPVLKNADTMTILDIAKKIQVLSEAARDKSIEIKDMKGASFSITNIGSIGGIHFTPIINPPEAAILGMGRIADQPVVKEGKVAIRKILPLMLAFDHRILDGAKAARFMNDVKKHLEDPGLFLVDVI